MPKQYEAMRDKFATEAGGPTGTDAPQSAKAKAARIYNASHPGAPVTRSESTSKPRSAQALFRKKDSA